MKIYLLTYLLMLLLFVNVDSRSLSVNSDDYYWLAVIRNLFWGVFSPLASHPYNLPVFLFFLIPFPLIPASGFGGAL